MNSLITVAAGGALGASFRYFLVLRIHALTGVVFPYGTLLVNVIGSVLIGCIYVLATERGLLNDSMRLLLMVGVLGSFTTFSTFSLEIINLLEQQRVLHAAGYVLTSVLLCLIGTWLGMTITRIATHA